MYKSHHPKKESVFWRAFQYFEWDIRNRVLTLSRLGLLPKLFGQDVSKIFKQKYSGNITLSPHMGFGQIFGIKALLNPDVEDMRHYLTRGAEAAWPFIRAVKHSLRMEVALREAVARLDAAMMADGGGGDVVTRGRSYSGEIREAGAREGEMLRGRILELEQENQRLKVVITMYEEEDKAHAFVVKGGGIVADEEEEEEENAADDDANEKHDKEEEQGGSRKRGGARSKATAATGKKAAAKASSPARRGSLRKSGKDE